MNHLLFVYPISSASTEERLARFEVELEMLIPGMSAAVVQDGAPLWARGFGCADQEEQITATAAYDG